MPIVKVFGLPENMVESDIERLYWKIADVVASIKELNITKDQVTVFFPSDRLMKGLGEEVIIEAELFAKPERTDKVIKQLAEKLGKTVKKEFDYASVKCLIKPFDEKKFWRSEPA